MLRKILREGRRLCMCVLLLSRPWIVNAWRGKIFEYKWEKGCIDIQKHAMGRTFWMHCVASYSPVHVGMCRVTGARSVADCEFSFAALKWSQTLPALKSTEGVLTLPIAVSYLFVQKAMQVRVWKLQTVVFVGPQDRQVSPVWSQNK